MADGDGDEGPELTDERWPTSPGDVDTASANNLKHEKWLGVPEWPSASNEWLSRRGHPLTPSPGEPYFHHWVEERPLASVRLGASDYQHRSRSSRSSCAATLWIPSPAPVPGVAPDPTRARAASSHVIQGGAAEAIDLERMSVGQRRVHPRAASTPSYTHHQHRSRIGTQPALPNREEGVATHVSVPLACREDVHAPVLGFRPGSAASRRAAGGRPPPWPRSQHDFALERLPRNPLYDTR
jgi:hypothetical protein